MDSFHTRLESTRSPGFGDLITFNPGASEQSQSQSMPVPGGESEVVRDSVLPGIN